MYIFVSFLNFNLQNIPAKKKKKPRELGLGFLQRESAAKEDGGLSPTSHPRPMSTLHCPAQGGGRWWETVGELGGGLGEWCFGIRSWAEAEGWGRAAQVWSPLLSDGASKLGRG